MKLHLKLVTLMTLCFMFLMGILVEKAAARDQNTGAKGFISLNTAVEMALAKNPDLKTFDSALLVLEAGIIQAGILPNPELEIEAENFGGSNDFNGYDAAETTVRFSQLVELAGKRSRRKQMASLARDAGEWERQAGRADLIYQVSTAFFDTLAAQERLALHGEMKALAEQVFQSVTERVNAGRVSPVEKLRANVAYSIARMDMEKAARRLDAARRNLALTWGDHAPSFESVEGDLASIWKIPPWESLEAFIKKNPVIQQRVTEIMLSQEDVGLAKAEKIPDVTLSLGAKHFNEGDDTAFVMGVSIPIPLFNQNQAERIQASHRLTQARQTHDAARLKILQDMVRVYESLLSAYAEAEAIKTVVLPTAESAFEAVNEGYDMGKYDYLVMLDSQQSLFEAKGRYVDALVQYHTAAAEMTRLTGTGLNFFKTFQ